MSSPQESTWGSNWDLELAIYVTTTSGCTAQSRGGFRRSEGELHHAALHCTPLHSTPLHCTALHYTTLHYTTLHYTPLRYTALHCTALHPTAPHPTAVRLSTSPMTRMKCSHQSTNRTLRAISMTSRGSHRTLLGVARAGNARAARRRTARPRALLLPHRSYSPRE